MGVMPENYAFSEPDLAAGLRAAEAANERARLPDPTRQALREARESGNRSYFDPPEFSVLRERFTPPATPDSSFVIECHGQSASGSQYGWVKNRIEWCVNAVAVDIQYDSRGARTGSMIMTYQMIGYGRDDGTRNVALYARPTSVSFSGIYTPATIISMTVDCSLGAAGCSGGGAHRATMAQLLTMVGNTDDWFRWNVSSDEAFSTLADKMSQHWFDQHVVFWDGKSKKLGDFGFRCDSADYFNARPKACVFSAVLPHLQYSILDRDGNDTNQRAVAEHIRQAQDDPNSTVPVKPDGDKDIPGKYTGLLDDRYLTRIVTDTTTGSTYSDNRAEVGRACAKITPPAGMERPECDEYPFASTLQGASSPRWDFSVKYVPGTQNSSAGNLLRRFYDDDRILYQQDPFYVEIRDRDGGPVSGPPSVGTLDEVQGFEGEPIELLASVTGNPSSLQWSIAPEPGSDTDPGTDCQFSKETIAAPTVTCDDNGTFIATVTVDDGVHPAVTGRTRVRVLNRPPSVRFVTPKDWQVFRVGQPIVFDAPITDAANDTHQCQYGWDAGDAWDEPFAAAGRNCGTTRSYEHAGMYSIELVVTDDDGGQGFAKVMIVVYDPEAGSANIDGSTTTPAGSLTSQPAATGQSWLHFTGAYTSATRPSGQNKVWVDGTTFRFEGTGMDWLVVTPDGKVAALGSGTIGGQAGYTWITYGWDACPGDGGCQNIPNDRIRMVVLNSATGATVYDNAPSDGNWDVDSIFPRDMTSGGVQIHR
ncbi:hypothetical protein Sru01_29630 [Sphaerisporangium rufum]|uniref:PKD domain-containing protein n=2 Tax=Sphaerisporangium rufum TaxID=1381558 RepID=A0A919UYE9_9ACTN|nr:hypothetical protein Sru01_29630 [Sphaerisporangium rufum]